MAIQCLVGEEQNFVTDPMLNKEANAILSTQG